MYRRTLTLLVGLMVCCAGTAWAGPPERGLATPWDGDAAVIDDGESGPRAAPDIYVDNSGACAPNPTGAPYTTTYCNLQAAIFDANANDVIHVAPGTYVEAGQIVINKNLTIVGDPANNPVIKPNQNSGDPSSGNNRGWFLVTAGNSLTLQHVTLDGVGQQICIAILSFGTVTVEDCVIKNIGWTPASYYGRGVCIYAGTGNVVRGCEFSDIYRIGVFAFYAGTEVTIDHCTYTGKDPGDWLDYGFELGGGAVGTITNNTVTDCEGVATVDGSTSAGILITTYFDPGTAGDVFGNVITGNTCGIAVGYDAADTSIVVANYNDVSGNTAEGIDNTSSTVTVDAEKNWWGTTDLSVIATIAGGLVDYDPPLLTDRIRMAFGGNRLVDMQNPDGGWAWPLTGGSAQNTIGPIGMGLAKAYRATSDPPGMVEALQNVATFLQAKTNNFSPPDGYLAAELDSILGGTANVDHLNTNFYGPLAGGTYDKDGAGPPYYDTADYVQLIRDSRAAQGIPNLAAWDVAMGLVAAASCGVSGTELDIWVNGVKDEIDEIDPDSGYETIALAGAVYGLAFVGEDYTAGGGGWCDGKDLGQLADLLVTLQVPATGGFAWDYNYVIPYEANESIQYTGYAILALNEMGGYATEVASAVQYMLGVQLPTGGWKSYVDSASENNEITAEALWGLWAASHGELTLEPDADCYESSDIVTVEIWMNDVGQTVAGGQFFLEYDDTKLALVSADPGDAPFTNQVFECSTDQQTTPGCTPTAGLLDYAVGIPLGGSGTSGDAKMATITFTALADICTEPDLITWRPHDPPTRLSDEYGGPVYPLTVNMDVVDDEPPVLENPDNVTVECDDLRLPDLLPEPWNHKMHYPQLPDPYGWDVNATAPNILADDWLCTHSGPVNDIHFWGSWFGDAVGMITNIHVSIHANIPGPPYSMPGTELWSADFGPGDFDEAEIDPYDPPSEQGWYDPETGTYQHPNHVRFFRYDIQNISSPFPQTAGQIYWLDIQVTATGGLWGWKTTQSHWNDDAVYWTGTGWEPLYDPLEPWQTLDLAFVITDDVDPIPDPFLGYAYAHDNCDPNPDVQYDDTTIPGSCPDNYTIQRMWTATDYCGNVSTCLQTITVQDTTAPTIVCDVTAQNNGEVDGNCEVTVDFSATITDNCCVDAGDVTWTATVTGNASMTFTTPISATQVDPKTVTLSGTAVVSDLTSCPATVTFTVDADDCCDNTGVQCSDTAGVTDSIVPVITCSADDADVDGNCQATVDFSATITDNCCVDVNSITVGASGTNVTVGAINFTPSAPGAVVTVTGTVAVSNVTDCPATVTITVDAEDCCGNHAVQCSDSADVDDTEYPVIHNCPQNITVNADAGGCTAVVTWTPEPTATDNCTVVSFTKTHSSGDTFPQGTTTVTYTATDECDNVTTCTFDVIVSGDNELVVNVDLEWSFTGTRCITFELWECTTPPYGPIQVEDVLSFSAGSASATVLVPCDYYDCITARDRLHTLRTTDASFTISATQYVADFTGADELLGGNLNDDYWIDILDFGVFSWQYGSSYGTGDTTCSTPYPHADISGNATVGSEDFTFIQINFLESHEANCCGEPGFRDGGPITEISVEELDAMGLSQLAAGDLNGDGWLDEADIAAFLAGARPKPPLQPVEPIDKFESAPPQESSPATPRRP